MGLIAKGLGALFGSAARTQALGQTVTQVAEVFRPNATRALERLRRFMPAIWRNFSTPAQAGSIPL